MGRGSFKPNFSVIAAFILGLIEGVRNLSVGSPGARRIIKKVSDTPRKRVGNAVISRLME